jgi:hypothetical protein
MPPPPPQPPANNTFNVKAPKTLMTFLNFFQRTLTNFNHLRALIDSVLTHTKDFNNGLPLFAFKNKLNAALLYAAYQSQMICNYYILLLLY